MPFKKGEVVELNSGGPKMTIQHIVGETTTKQQTFAFEVSGSQEGDLITQWFAGNELKTGTFSPELVHIVE
jgi:uncharacterized protein YodC (DUF2158 family)